MSGPGFVYVISGKYQKIGHSRSPQSRLDQFKTASPYKLTLTFVLECENAERAERLAHERLRANRLAGEWFDITAEVAIEAVKEAVANVDGDRPRVAAVEPESEVVALKRKAVATDKFMWELLRLLQTVQWSAARHYEQTGHFVLEQACEARILGLLQLNGLEMYAADEYVDPTKDAEEPFDDGWAPIKKEVAA